MKSRLLTIILMSSVITLVIIGIHSLRIREDILLSFEKEEKHFKEIATAATEVVSYSKRAEGHLMLYLALHRQADGQKYPLRIQSMHKNISIIDENLQNPEARHILEEIVSQTGQTLGIGNSLIAAHDRDMEQSGRFDMVKYKDAIIGLNERFSAIRGLGVELATMLIKMEDDFKADIYKSAMRSRFYMLAFIGFAAFLIVYVVIVLQSMVSTLNKEIAVREKNEKLLNEERDKLKKALSEVKALSGLLPICASCKKIRDDQGYWNQIEAYISEHSDAEISHGICPECQRKYSPGPEKKE